MKSRHCWIIAAVFLFCPNFASAQTTISGNQLALSSTGSNVLNQNGYVGTYITLASPATISLTVNAQSASGAGAAPHMSVVVDDSTSSYDVATSAADYSTSISLPAGTHFIRTQLSNYSGRNLTINSLTVGGGATVSNSSTDANALAAANTYIANFRQGPATVALSGPGGVALLPGTPVQATLTQHAFNFGGTISGTTSNPDLASNPAPGSTAYNFQQFVNSHFNTIVPSNGGKWAYNEPTQNAVTMGFVDQILNYAQSHGMRARMHNVIWGSGATGGNQQPAWVNSLISSAAGGNAAAKTALINAISSRLNYYVGTSGDRAQKYIEIDGLNESLHNPSYWNILGASGVAQIYNQLAADAAAAGNPDLRAYLNEYNVLQFSPASISSTGVQSGSDPYANWYRRNVEDVRNAGGDVSGIGVQYYADARTTLGSNVHSAATIEKALQNLSVEGLPISLNEFGLASGTSQSDGARIMDDTMRMVFGTPQATTFMIWGWYADPGQPTPPAALVDSNAWTLTPMGQKWEELMSQWTTNVTPTVAADGTIHFNGFYGAYSIGGQSGALNLTKSQAAYSAALTAPPTWSIWNANISGAWSMAANWTTGGPTDSPGQTAYFGSATSARSISVDADRTAGMLVFDSVNAWQIDGPGTLNLQGFNVAGGHVAAIDVTAGHHTINAPLKMLDDTTVNIAPNDGLLTITNLQPTSAALTKTGNGTLVVNAVPSGALAVTGGQLRIAPRGSSGAMRAASISVSASASLDVSDNRIVTGGEIGSWDGSKYTGLSGLIQRGRNGGNWNGSGIITSTAKPGDNLTTIGIATSDELGLVGQTWNGQSLSSGDVLLMYTWGGDANLDGVINIDDYGRIDSSVGLSGASGWFNGDFNYDGKINIDDYGIIDSNIGLQGTVPLSFIGEVMQGNSVVATPDPAGLMIAALLLMACLPRARRFHPYSQP